MLLKAGVSLERLNIEIRRTLNPVGAWINGMSEEMVITSTDCGDHMAGSLHYCNDAYDFRRPGRADRGELIRVRKLLGKDFDVVFYAEVIHVEYDPKGAGAPPPAWMMSDNGGALSTE